MKLTIDTLRPCLIGRRDEKALFHCWYNDNGVLYAIVELENGRVESLTYRKGLIKFVDNKFAEYDFTYLKGENKDDKT